MGRHHYKSLVALLAFGLLILLPIYYLQQFYGLSDTLQELVHTDSANNKMKYSSPSLYHDSHFVHVSNRTNKISFIQYDIQGFQWEKESKAALKLVDGLWIYPSIPVYNTKIIKESELLNYLVQRQILCDRHYRAGSLGDGGWDVCLVGNFKPRTSGCLVYSFGIDYDFSFDDEMGKEFNCTVYAFDPSMKYMNSATTRGNGVVFFPEGLGSSRTVTKDGWKMDTLDGFMQRFGHSKHIIDYLKMDIEHAEYDAISQIIKSGKFSQVKQFGFEIHRPRKFYKDTRNTSAARIYALLQALEAEGFRKWHIHFNPACAYATHFGMDTSHCIEIYFLNKKFIRP